MPTEDLNTQNFEAIEQVPDKGINLSAQSGNQKKKIILILSGALVLILLLVLVIVGSNNRVLILPTPTPEPIPTPTPFVETIASPSAYATDSAVLKIGDDINDLENQLQNIDLKDNYLLPPAINLDINFNPN